MSDPNYSTATPPYPGPDGGSPHAGTGFYVDQASGLTLPDGVQLASHGRRMGAYFLAVPLMIVTLVIGYIIWGLIAWSKGTSPALQVLGMKAYRPEQRQVATFGTMALRNIVGGFIEGVLSCITLFISFILFLARPDRRALHDLIAGTVVLHDPNKVLG